MIKLIHSIPVSKCNRWCMYWSSSQCKSGSWIKSRSEYVFKFGSIYKFGFTSNSCAGIGIWNHPRYCSYSWSSRTPLNKSLPYLKCIKY